MGFDSKEGPLQRQRQIASQLNGDEPSSSAVARRGLKTSQDFAEFMTALMADLVEGKIDHQSAAAACYAGDMLLKVVKMQIQHGQMVKGGAKVLPLLEKTTDQNSGPAKTGE